MSRTTKMVVGILVGGLCSGVLGGLTLATPALLDTSSEPGFMGPPRNWAPVLFVMGAFFGVIHGAVAGVIIGAANVGKAAASLIGAAVAFPVSAYLFLESGTRDREIRLVAALCPLAGALAGLLVSIVLGLRRKNAGPPV